MKDYVSSVFLFIDYLLCKKIQLNNDIEVNVRWIVKCRAHYASPNKGVIGKTA